MRLFNKKKTNNTTEQAPQLTIWDRATFAQPGTRFGQLGYETYDEMLKDSMVQTVFTLKKLAIMAATYQIEPASNTDSAKQKAEFVAKIKESQQQFKEGKFSTIPLDEIWK